MALVYHYTNSRMSGMDGETSFSPLTLDSSLAREEDEGTNKYCQGCSYNYNIQAFLVPLRIWGS